MAFFVPNLAAKRAIVGGAIGGTIGALALLTIPETYGEFPGHLFAAAILGLVLGLLIVIIEKAFREAWLEISYGPKETVTVNLGEKAVTIGSNSNACTVFAMGAPPIALRYRRVGGQIECEDVVREQSSTVQPGDERTVGSIKIKVCTSGA